MSHSRSPVGYRPEIDGLRAIAVLAVVLFHARVLGVPVRAGISRKEYLPPVIGRRVPVAGAGSQG